MALADELKLKQLSEALLMVGFLQQGLHAEGGLHLPEPSLLEEKGWDIAVGLMHHQAISTNEVPK